MVRFTRKSRKQTGGATNNPGIIVQWTNYSGFGNILYMYAFSLLVKEKTNKPIYALPTSSNHSKTDYRFLLKQIIPIGLMDNTQKRMTDANKSIKLYNYCSDYTNSIIPQTAGDILLNYKSTYTCVQCVETIVHIIPIIYKEIFEVLSKRYPIKIDELSSCFLQIRRGDFVKINWTLNKDYYQRALDLINKIDTIHTIYIITTDFNWVREQEFNIKKNVIWIDSPDELYAFYIMMLCKGGAILSNSTYGQWGALLGADMNKSSTIISPLNTKGQHRGLPKRWILV